VFLTAAKVKKRRIFVAVIGVCTGFSAAGKNQVSFCAVSCFFEEVQPVPADRGS
jgi:hypothetical protein